MLRLTSTLFLLSRKEKFLNGIPSSSTHCQVSVLLIEVFKHILAPRPNWETERVWQECTLCVDVPILCIFCVCMCMCVYADSVYMLCVLCAVCICWFRGWGLRSWVTVGKGVQRRVAHVGVGVLGWWDMRDEGWGELLGNRRRCCGSLVPPDMLCVSPLPPPCSQVLETDQVWWWVSRSLICEWQKTCCCIWDNILHKPNHF